VPIRKFIEHDGFDPETILNMNAALFGACRALGLKVKDDEATRLLAMRIIELARDGERNPERLRAAALKDFSR
jgi:urease gamma subunit